MIIDSKPPMSAKFLIPYQNIILLVLKRIQTNV